MSEDTPTSDEKVMSGIAYFFGLFGAALVWLIQKDKSRYVRFHATQALAFDFFVMIAMGFVLFCAINIMVVGALGSAFTTVNSSSASDPFPLFVLFPMFMPFAIFACVMPFSLGLTIIRVIAALSVLSGRNFHYPFLGSRVEIFLGDSM